MSVNTSDYMYIILILILTFSGALSNDYYNTISDKDDKIRIGRVLLGTITSSLIIMVVTEYTSIIRRGTNLYLFSCYLAGIGGFRAFSWLIGVDLVKLALALLKVNIDDIKKVRVEDENKKE